MDDDTQRNIEHELTRLDDDLTRISKDAADLPTLRQNIKDLTRALEILMSSEPLSNPGLGVRGAARTELASIVARLPR